MQHTSAQIITTSKTAVSFPKASIPADGGKIEFWAKLEGFSGDIPVGGTSPYFFIIMDGTTSYSMGFNSNDGVGNGGLVGCAGNYCVGTGVYNSWSYENIYGAGKVNEWHHYRFEWNRDGLPGLENKYVAIYIDGKLNSTSQNEGNSGNYDTIVSCARLTLLAVGNPVELTETVAIDEFKIYDKNNKLILWNTMGSPEEISNSKVGVNGSLDGFGNPKFIQGIAGNAIAATPLLPQAEAACNEPVQGKCCIYVPGKLYSCTAGVTIDQCAYIFSQSAQASDLLFSENENCSEVCPKQPDVVFQRIENFRGSYNSSSRSILLAWRISGLNEKYRYFIERSQDGNRFKKIAFLDRRNLPINGENDFEDINPMAVNFYRLVVISPNGNLIKSQTLPVIGSQKNVLLYPNPVKNNFRIIFPGKEQVGAKVFVYNRLGKEVLNSLVGEQDGNVNVSNLKPGIYSIRILSGGVVYTQRFIKN